MTTKQFYKKVDRVHRWDKSDAFWAVLVFSTVVCILFGLAAGWSHHHPSLHPYGRVLLLFLPIPITVLLCKLRAMIALDKIRKTFNRPDLRVVYLPVCNPEKYARQQRKLAEKKQREKIRKVVGKV